MKNNYELLISANDNDSAKAIYALDRLKSLQSENMLAIKELAQAWRAEVDKLPN